MQDYASAILEKAYLNEIEARRRRRERDAGTP